MNTWFISDTHFHHANILTFTGKDGSRIRPSFTSVEEMDEYMVIMWNRFVKPNDKVYHLGDVLLGTSIKAFEILSRLNGRKVLIKGNHDIAKPQRYLEHFTDIRSEAHLKTPKGKKVIFTHRPILLNPIFPDRPIEYNVHGHIHEKEIDDERYINVSVEALQYAPISFDDLLKRIE